GVCVSVSDVAARLYPVNLIMKSRVMGDYQARFCERFGSEILPYLLDPSRQFKVLLNLNFESIESMCLNGPSTISLLALCLTETNSVPNQLSSSRLKLLLDSKVVPLLVFSIILNPLFEKYSSVRFFAFSMSSVSVISSRNRLAPNVTPKEIVNGKIITLNHHKGEYISNAVQDVDK
ncbi:MAG: hypothetical protein ACK5R0_15125, partial [Bacteroidota bacterium]